MLPSITGHVSLPVEPGIRLDTGRFLSTLAVRLEARGADVRRQAGTLTFKNLWTGPGKRPPIWFDGEAAVEAGSGKPLLRYQLRFSGVFLTTAAAAGALVGITVWQTRTLMIPACLGVAVAIMVGFQAVGALIAVGWFRWFVQAISRDVTYRPPRTAA